MIQRRNHLGQWESLAAGLISVGGQLGSQAIQSDLAKSIAKKQAGLAVTQQKLEKERQVELLKAQAATLERQITAEAMADVARKKAETGYWGSIAPYAIGGIALVGVLAIAWRLA